MTRWRLLLIAAAVLLMRSWAGAQGEQILAFDSRIEVRRDASMGVAETIRVVATGDQIKRGIYRDFPQLYRTKAGLRKLTGFRVVKVTRNGAAEPFHTQPKDNGTRVYIGSSSVNVPPGEHIYALTYETDAQLGFFPAHDELYWNVTGNGWVFPIQKATATVSLPDGTPISSMEAYTGAQGSKGKDFAAWEVNGTACFETMRALGAREGLTIVVTWPKGWVAAPTVAATRDELIRANKGVVFAGAGLVAVLLYYVVAWMIAGRDPAPGTIIPLYDPPAGFSPPAVRYLKQMGYDQKVYTAGVIDLAVKGAVEIQQSGKDYTLIRKTEGAQPLTPDETALLASLFSGAARLELKNANHARVSAAGNALKKELSRQLEKTHFVRNLKFWFPGLLFSLVPLAISLRDSQDIGGAIFMFFWLAIWSIGVTALVSAAVGLWRKGTWFQALMISLFALPFLAGEIFGLWMLVKATSIWVAGLFGAGVLMNGVFYHLLKAPTHFGRRILDQIDGFKEYLSVAEKDRLNLENPPERTPALFEKFLPYALALEVEQQWSEQFAAVLAKAQEEGWQPRWITGAVLSGFAAGSFGSALNDSLSSAISSASTAPGSSSGSGGGGSSGGGGGGGGGGGW